MKEWAIVYVVTVVLLATFLSVVWGVEHLRGRVPPPLALLMFLSMTWPVCAVVYGLMVIIKVCKGLVE
jgi:hypothetical protein